MSPFFKRKAPKKEKTQIIVQYDAGFSNNLFIRGEGIPDLSWDQGKQLTNLKSDEWLWETEDNFKDGMFKILINDEIFEIGGNHYIEPGTILRMNPKFPAS